MADVLYILGTGSRWNNNELRYSLRSLERHCRNVDRVFVSGENPGFLSGEVTYINQPDVFTPANADGNMIVKVAKACNSGISDRFLYCCDDYIFNKNIDIEQIRWFYEADMNKYGKRYWSVQSIHRKRLKRTFELLVSKGFTAYRYDCHTPVMISREKFLSVVSMFDYSDDIGYTIKSLYGNIAGVKKMALHWERANVFEPLDMEKILNRVRHCLFFAYNDAGLNDSMKRYLSDRFPEKSKYEI